MSGRRRQGSAGPPQPVAELAQVEFSGGRAERLVVTPGEAALEWVDWQGDRLTLVLLGVTRLEDAGVTGAELARGQGEPLADGAGLVSLWRAGAEGPALRLWARAFRLEPRRA